ncbi:cation:proton antiporter [Microbacterium aquimaris]|uniref:cation:proton antiporter n=1 Tax=Microbacterium aquimaris TaxID=459816 RepID=UPI002AD2A418|nr:cation:proton antiporter [Microbacterium aquimaris]MDZ8276620.1 cation:proton antiporter [Microbacterium aquimaris]
MSVQLLAAIVVAVIVVTLANAFASRIGVAGPLVIMAIGVAVSLVPAMPAVSIAPEIILVGILPPLLYSAAVAAPAREFTRDAGAIGGLSVVLVIVSSLLLGLALAWAIPGLGFPLAVALGAILSPTDAVATTIVKSLGVPRRVVTILEGESLLNDATALVTLRTAIAATAAGFSVITTVGSFIWAVLSAVVVGGLVGLVALRLRAWTRSATANTALGFTIPYLAYLPTEYLGGSGLVAAVAAGLVCGQGAARWLTPEQRISDKLNWSTVEFVLEGVVFLAMGLQLWGIIERNIAADEGLGRAVGIAALAFAVVMVARAAYVFPMVSVRNAILTRSVRRRLTAAEGERRARGRPDARRARADSDYFESSPLTWRHSTVIVWAGMRGVVTLAAAQTLPADTPERDLLVLVAFIVAAGSLAVQGGTLGLVVKMLGLRGQGREGPSREEIRAIDGDLRRLTAHALEEGRIAIPDDRDAATVLSRSHLFRTLRADARGPAVTEGLDLELALIRTMRAELRTLARSGRYSTPSLRYVRDELDAYEISVKLHLDGAE